MTADEMLSADPTFAEVCDARAEGATLTEAAAEFRRVVRLRAATVRALLGPEDES